MFFPTPKQLEINFYNKSQDTKADDRSSDPILSLTSDIYHSKPKYSVVFGDIWQVGQQTVICADASNPNSWDRGLAHLETQFVNLVFTSPPYASQRRYDPKSEFKPVPLDKYVEWFKPFQENIQKRLSEDGSFCFNIKEHCQSGQRHLYVSDLKIAMVRQWGWRWIDELIWHKNGFPGYWEHRLRDDFERVFHFALGKPKLNKDAIAIPRKYDGHFWSGFNGNTQGQSAASGNNTAKVIDRVLPGNVLKMPVENGQTGHPAAFPVGLPEFFIKAFTGVGDLVCDPFAGSGTTAVASFRERRRSLNFEISPAYCEICLERLSRSTGQTPKKIGEVF